MYVRVIVMGGGGGEGCGEVIYGGGGGGGKGEFRSFARHHQRNRWRSCTVNEYIADPGKKKQTEGV